MYAYKRVEGAFGSRGTTSRPLGTWGRGSIAKFAIAGGGGVEGGSGGVMGDQRRLLVALENANQWGEGEEVGSLETDVAVMGTWERSPLIWSSFVTSR